MNIAAYIITHNGLEDNLPDTVQSLSKVVDDITVSVSDASTDGTKQWCRNNADIDRVLVDIEEFPREEPTIRMRAVDAMREANPDADMFIALDDDEILLSPEKTMSAFEQVQQYGADAAGSIVYHVWEEDKIRVDGTWKPGSVLRVMTANPDALQDTWNEEEGPHCGRFPFAQELKLTGNPVPILHYGWDVPQDQRRSKMERRGDHVSEEEIQRKHYESLDREPTLMEMGDGWDRWM